MIHISEPTVGTQNGVESEAPNHIAKVAIVIPFHRPAFGFATQVQHSSGLHSYSFVYVIR